MQSSETNSYNTTSSLKCQSHKPGHQVHWIQARVKSEEPRFDAEVVVLDETTVRVSWQDQTSILRNHLTARIQTALQEKASDYIKYAPSSKLLYVQSDLPNGTHGGAFKLFYLAEGDLSACQFQQIQQIFLKPQAEQKFYHGITSKVHLDFRRLFLGCTTIEI